MAKKGKYGHPGSSGLAQSGGINKTFGGGKGGTAASRKSTTDRKIGSGRMNNGLQYNIRSMGGDKAMVGDTPTVGAPPPVTAQGAKAKPKVAIRPPVRKGGR